jgi:hydroxylaminobenzene mutase
VAAVFGTAALSPITAAGHSGKGWQELLVTALFVSVGLATVTMAVMVLWGLRAAAAHKDNSVNHGQSARA